LHLKSGKTPFICLDKHAAVVSQTLCKQSKAPAANISGANGKLAAKNNKRKSFSCP